MVDLAWISVFFVYCAVLFVGNHCGDIELQMCVCKHVQINDISSPPAVIRKTAVRNRDYQKLQEQKQQNTGHVRKRTTTTRHIVEKNNQEYSVILIAR